jgi:hypothetical protein
MTIFRFSDIFNKIKEEQALQKIKEERLARTEQRISAFKAFKKTVKQMHLHPTTYEFENVVVNDTSYSGTLSIGYKESETIDYRTQFQGIDLLIIIPGNIQIDSSEEEIYDYSILIPLTQSIEEAIGYQEIENHIKERIDRGTMT